MGHYTDYISFLVSDEAFESPARMGDLHLPDDVELAFRSALEEIYATPEGAKLIKGAALQANNGKVHILHSAEEFVGSELADTTAAFMADTYGEAHIVIGSDVLGVEYLTNNQDQQYYPVSLQRLIVHELAHIKLGHASQRNDELSEEEQTEVFEQEVRLLTNEFMGKYYNEPSRVDHDAYVSDDGSCNLRFAKRIDPDQEKMGLIGLKNKLLNGFNAVVDYLVGDPALDGVKRDAAPAVITEEGISSNCSLMPVPGG